MRKLAKIHGRTLPAGALATWTAIASHPATADEPPTFADRSDEALRDADRSRALLLNPLAMPMGIFGAEADWAPVRFAALALEAAVYLRQGVPATAVGVGLLFYPQGSVFRGLFVEPRLVYARPVAEPVPELDWSIDVVGAGGTVGWQWTWDYGFTVRLGGGVIDFLGGSRTDAAGDAVALGPSLVVDGCVGWVFQ